MTFLLGFVLALTGMFSLAAAQSKQAKLLLKSVPAGTSRLTLIGLGTLMLIASSWQAVTAFGMGVGFVTFFSHVCFAAWIVALTLTRRRGQL